MADINLKMKINFLYTPVSNVFIDDYMVSANPVFVTIYLYALKKCTQGESTSNQEIAQKFKILESDVVNAWQYWSKQNIIKVNNNDVLEIEFLEIKPKSDNTQIIQNNKNDKNVVKNLIGEVPKYSIKELEIYQQKSSEVRELFSKAQNTLGKLFTYNDLSTIFGLYDWLRMPINVIEVLLTYCASNDHCNMRYIEKVAIDWTDKEINTPEKAYELIKLYNVEYREIMKSLGIGNKQPIENQEVYMNKWVNEYKMPIDIIKKACSKAVMATGSSSFSYADKIITSWYKKNVKTFNDVDREETEFKNRIKLERELTKNKVYVKRNRFVNYDQRNWDFDELKKLERELMERDLMERELMEKKLMERASVERELTERELTERELMERELMERELMERELMERELMERELMERELMERELMERELMAKDLKE